MITGYRVVGQQLTPIGICKRYYYIGTCMLKFTLHDAMGANVVLGSTFEQGFTGPTVYMSINN